MKIHQIYTDSQLRNFTYFIELSDKTAIVIDPWTDQLVNDFLQKHDLNLTTIINTHEHWDHTQGNEPLVQQHGCEVWAHANGQNTIPCLSRVLTAGEQISLDQDNAILVMDTPGHSQAHLCFLVMIKDRPVYVFTGDILFNAGVGNCRNGGNVDDLYNTISEKFHTMADDVLVLPGHEYLGNNLRFTLDREPSNEHAQHWLEKYQQSDVYDKPLTTTIGDERNINTFFRLNNPEIIQHLGKNTDGEKSVFVALRALRDKW